MARPIAHGGGLIAGRRRYPHAPEPWIDLSTGINPVPYPLPPLPPEVFTRLPEPETVAALEAVAAAAYGARDPATVVAAAGTQSLIHLLPRLIPARRVAVVGPTYAEHAAAWALAGSAVATVASLHEATGSDVTVLCNPNNPDGARHGPRELARCQPPIPSPACGRGEGALLVIDEAFADLDGESHVPTLADGSIVLRSFGKAYGLAGIRLGFAVAAPALAARMRAALGPWAVSGPALHVGAIALADRGWLEATAARLADEAARLDALLAGAGCCVVGGTRLFRLVTHPAAAPLADRLARAGILVRRFGDAPDRLRFGIPGAETAWQRLRAALQ